MTVTITRLTEIIPVSPDHPAALASAIPPAERATTADIARFLGVCQRTVTRLTSRGPDPLPVVRVNRHHYLYDQRSVWAWLLRQEETWPDETSAAAPAQGTGGRLMAA